MERKLCKRCGNWFTTKGDSTMCQYCQAIVIHEDCGGCEEDLYYKPIRRKGTTQLEIDAKAASDAGLSYGEYMARKGRRV